MTYNNNVLVGNWSEERLKNEVFCNLNNEYKFFFL